MSRKPVVALASSGRPYGRQAMWDAMRQLRRFTLSDLADKWGRDAVREYAWCLEAGGYLKRVGESARFQPIVYELVRDVGREAPRLQRDGRPVTQGAGREQMWRAMKMLPNFTFVDLAINASTEAVRVGEAEAQDYVHYLLRAKYLVIVRPATPRAKAVYRLARNTGPRPPMVTRAKVVFDPNLGCIAWCEEVDA
jgi:hypothetical protein